MLMLSLPIETSPLLKINSVLPCLMSEK
jgi:hypothetical protein